MKQKNDAPPLYGRIRELLVIGLVEAAGGFCGVGIAR